MRFSRNLRRYSQPLSIVSCTDKLRQNDPGFVELSLERLGDDFDLDDFVHAIRSNFTVRHVCFSGTFVRELQQDQWCTMLEAIGHLEALEELQIWCSAIPVAVFSRTLQNAQLLHKVYLFRVTLEGTQQDFDEWAASIQDQPSLRDCRIGGFQIPDNISLDNVLKAFSLAPSLEVVSLQLTGVHAIVPFTGPALGMLFTSKTINDLYLSRLGLQREHYIVIAEAISKQEQDDNDNAGCTLRVLDLFGNNVENEHVVLIANAVKTNTSLVTLVLPCPSEDLSVESCIAISEALQENNTLVTLNLPRSTLTDEGLEHIAQGLTVNTTIKKIEVGVSKTLSNKGTNALIEMLDRNYKLERFVVSSAEESIKDKVMYYMRLNEVGRGSILRRNDGTAATREQWVEMLISVKDDLDCLFYFTSMNPTICQFESALGADVIVTQEYEHTPVRRRHTIAWDSSQHRQKDEYHTGERHHHCDHPRAVSIQHVSLE